MPSKFESLNGTISGRGSTTVLLGHGFGTDQSAWNPVRGWLDARYRVISYDLAGAGPAAEASYDPQRYQSLFGYADDLLQIADECQLRHCIYIAHSVSSMIGIAAQLTRPTLFDRLILIGASPRYLNDSGYTGGFEQQDLDGIYDGMAANFQAWAAGFAPMVVGAPEGHALKEFMRTLFLMRPDIAQHVCRTIFQSDMRDLVPKLDRPTHLVQTRADVAVPYAVAEWLHQHIAGSTLDVIDAEGHLPHLSAPERVIEVFARYLQA